jgi:hypothetical protein
MHVWFVCKKCSYDSDEFFLPKILFEVQKRQDPLLVANPMKKSYKYSCTNFVSIKMKELYDFSLCIVCISVLPTTFFG